jgi:hypothetical protein
MDQQESRFHPIGNKEGRQVIWRANSKNIIPPSMFHLNRVESGKDDRSSEAHLQSSKNSRGSYLDQELSIFV